LNRALGSAEAGSGRLVLVTGDAGTGKTVLVRRFSTELDEHRLLWGMCDDLVVPRPDRKSTRLNSSHVKISYAVFCLKKKNAHGGVGSPCVGVGVGAVWPARGVSRSHLLGGRAPATVPRTRTLVQCPAPTGPCTRLAP